jgi:hypothetical protein
VITIAAHFQHLKGYHVSQRSWKLSVQGSFIQVEVLQTRHIPKPTGCNWVVEDIVGEIELLKV